MMSFVDDTFSESRSISEARRIVGKAEKSRGREIKSVTVKIKMANPKDMARPMSKTQAGIGRIIMTITAIKAIARRTVGLKSSRTVKTGMGYDHSDASNNDRPACGRTGTSDPNCVRAAPFPMSG